MPLSKIKTNSVADEVFKAGSNLIINGGMTISQRGSTFADLGNGYYGIDRFIIYHSDDGAVTVSQDTTVPAGEGFKNSMKFDVTTADTSLGSSQYYQFSQKIEGQNMAHLEWGTSNAKSVTLSFWIRSNLTGTYNVYFLNNAANRYYPVNFTIDSANTWEKKTITVAGDTTGTWLTTNGVGMYVVWNLALSSNYLTGTNATWGTNDSGVSGTTQANFLSSTSNELYITGVQLEVGEQATPFQHEDIGATLKKCQRYFYSFDLQSLQAHPMWAYAANSLSTRLTFPTTMRAQPNGSITGTYGNNSQDWSLYNNGGWKTISSINTSELNTNSIRINCSVSSGVSATDAAGLYHLGIDGGGTLTADAEL